MYRRKFSIIAMAVLLVCAADWAGADEVVLKSGRKITGAIEMENEGFVRIRSSGAVLVIQRSDVARISHAFNRNDTRSAIEQTWEKGEAIKTYNMALEYLTTFPDDVEVEYLKQQAESRIQDDCDALIKRLLEKKSQGDETYAKLSEMLDQLPAGSRTHEQIRSKTVELARKLCVRMLEDKDDQLDGLLKWVEPYCNDKQWLYLEQARAAIAQRRYNEARQLLEFNISDLKLRALRDALKLQLLLHEERFVDAADTAMRASFLDSIEPEDLRNDIRERLSPALKAAAREATQNGNFADAKKYYEKYIAVSPDDEDTQRGAIEFYRAVHDSAKASEHEAMLERLKYIKQSKHDPRIAKYLHEDEFQLSLYSSLQDAALADCKYTMRSILLVIIDNREYDSRQLKEWLENDKRLRVEIAKWFVIVVADIRTAEGKEFCEKYQVQTAPRILAIDRNLVVRDEIAVPTASDEFFDAYKAMLSRFLQAMAGN
ncbi:hypothetical protein JXA32_14535 [Candidatus Sumerlaeota bacterium]|nr:hypothetical protein [Candidatus Sumerlaeota bacterium]